MNGIKNFFNMLKVFDFGLTKIRLGNDHDGGYVVYKELCESTEAIHTYGVGDDIGFELDFIKRFGPRPIYLNDPTIYKAPLEADEYDYIYFNKKGVEQEYSFDFDYKSLLKIDAEWHEWEAMDRLIYDSAPLFDQILIELHVVPIIGMDKGNSPYFNQFYSGIQDHLNRNLFAEYCEALRNLLQGHYIYHIHVNNSLPEVTVGGVTFPPLIELSMIGRHVVKEMSLPMTGYNGPFPIKGLDAPNKTDRPDITEYKFLSCYQNDQSK